MMTGARARRRLTPGERRCSPARGSLAIVERTRRSSCGSRHCRQDSDLHHTTKRTRVMSSTRVVFIGRCDRHCRDIADVRGIPHHDKPVICRFMAAVPCEAWMSARRTRRTPWRLSTLPQAKSSKEYAAHGATPASPGFRLRYDPRIHRTGTTRFRRRPAARSSVATAQAKVDMVRYRPARDQALRPAP